MVPIGQLLEDFNEAEQLLDGSSDSGAVKFCELYHKMRMPSQANVYLERLPLANKTMTKVQVGIPGLRYTTGS